MCDAIVSQLSMTSRSVCCYAATFDSNRIEGTHERWAMLGRMSIEHKQFESDIETEVFTPTALMESSYVYRCVRLQRPILPLRRDLTGAVAALRGGCKFLSCEGRKGRRR